MTDGNRNTEIAVEFIKKHLPGLEISDRVFPMIRHEYTLLLTFEEEEWKKYIDEKDYARDFREVSDLDLEISMPNKEAVMVKEIIIKRVWSYSEMAGAYKPSVKIVYTSDLEIRNK